MRNPLLLTCLVLLLAACTQGNIDLDNAGDQDLTVRIDEMTYQMPAGEYRNLTLEKGKHKVTVLDSDGKVVDESIINVNNGGLINLAKGDYIIWTDLYGDEDRALRKEVLDEREIAFDKERYMIDYERIPADRLYIEKAWEFGLDEEFPSALRGWSVAKKKWIKKRKLFREEELKLTLRALANPAAE